MLVGMLALTNVYRSVNFAGTARVQSSHEELFSSKVVKSWIWCEYSTCVAVGQ
jgi:hypothetical protein